MYRKTILFITGILLVLPSFCLYAQEKWDGLPEKGASPDSPSYWGKYSIEMSNIPPQDWYSDEVAPYPIENRPIYNFSCTPASLAEMLDLIIPDPLQEYTFWCFAKPAGGKYWAEDQAECTWLPVECEPLKQDGQEMQLHTALLTIKGETDGGEYGYTLNFWFDDNKVIYAVRGNAWWAEEGGENAGSYLYLLETLNGKSVGKLGFGIGR